MKSDIFVDNGDGTVTVKTGNISPVHYAVDCLICYKTIRYIEYPAHIPEICDDCRAAVMAVRKQLDI